MDQEESDLSALPAPLVRPEAQAEPEARGVLGLLVQQALRDLPAARAEVVALEARAVRAVLEARAAREALAVLEGLAPSVPLDPQEALVDQVALADPAGRAAWVRPVPRAVQAVQAVRAARDLTS